MFIIVIMLGLLCRMYSILVPAAVIMPANIVYPMLDISLISGVCFTASSWSVINFSLKFSGMHFSSGMHLSLMSAASCRWNGVVNSIPIIKILLACFFVSASLYSVVNCMV